MSISFSGLHFSAWLNGRSRFVCFLLFIYYCYTVCRAKLEQISCFAPEWCTAAAAADDHEYDHGGIKNHAMVSHLRIIGNDHQVGVDEPTKVPGATSNPSVFIHKSSTK